MFHVSDFIDALRYYALNFQLTQQIHLLLFPSTLKISGKLESKTKLEADRSMTAKRAKIYIRM